MQAGPTDRFSRITCYIVTERHQDVTYCDEVVLSSGHSDCACGQRLLALATASTAGLRYRTNPKARAYHAAALTECSHEVSNAGRHKDRHAPISAASHRTPVAAYGCSADENIIMLDFRGTIWSSCGIRAHGHPVCSRSTLCPGKALRLSLRQPQTDTSG